MMVSGGSAALLVRKEGILVVTMVITLHPLTYYSSSSFVENFWILMNTYLMVLLFSSMSILSAISSFEKKGDIWQ